MQTLQLILSSFISSWQFFKESTAAPRIDFCLEAESGELMQEWQNFNLKPERLSLGDFLKSIFFNARWNEYLYIIDCAERLVLEPEQDCYPELIMQRLLSFLKHDDLEGYFKYRIVFLVNNNGNISEEIVFISEREKL